MAGDSGDMRNLSWFSDSGRGSLLPLFEAALTEAIMKAMKDLGGTP